MMTEAMVQIHLQNSSHHSAVYAPPRETRPQRRTEITRSKSHVTKNLSSTNVLNAMKSNDIKRGGSFVVGQKLRESKWFSHVELNVFCAVVETGFIVENDKGQFGIAIWVPGHEKSKDPHFLTIYTLLENKDKHKVIAQTLAEFWPIGTTLRINNKSDKTETPLTEDEVRGQINFAENSKRKWHNTEHFTYFCRYGPVEVNARSRKITDQLKWNGASLFLKFKSLSAK